MSTDISYLYIAYSHTQQASSKLPPNLHRGIGRASLQRPAFQGGCAGGLGGSAQRGDRARRARGPEGDGIAALQSAAVDASRPGPEEVKCFLALSLLQQARGEAVMVT
eukprot:4558977-Pleurochrysis_carterae.AAC.1